MDVTIELDAFCGPARFLASEFHVGTLKFSAKAHGSSTSHGYKTRRGNLKGLTFATETPVIQIEEEERLTDDEETEGGEESSDDKDEESSDDDEEEEGAMEEGNEEEGEEKEIEDEESSDGDIFFRLGTAAGREKERLKRSKSRRKREFGKKKKVKKKAAEQRVIGMCFGGLVSVQGPNGYVTWETVTVSAG